MTNTDATVFLLGDADPGVRLRAALDLGERRVEGAADALVERLGLEREFFIRESLTWAVLRVIEAAEPALRAALTSPRWLARMQAAHVFSKLGRADDAALLVPLAADPVDVVAARAAWALSQTGNPAAVPALIAQLGRGDSEFHNSLSVALAGLGQLAVVALVEAMRHGRPGVRAHAADTLSLIGSPDAEGAVLGLSEAIEDPAQPVRIAALNALGQLRSESAQSAVVNLRTQDPLLADLAARLRRRRTRPIPLTRPTGGRTGVVAAAPGVLVSLECDTPIVAHSRTLRNLAQRVADGDETNLDEALQRLSEVSGEYVTMGEVHRCPGQTVHVLDGCVGAMVAYTGPVAGQEYVRQVARHVLVNAPAYLSRADVPPDTLREVAAAARRTCGAPASMLEEIGAGAAEQYVHQNVLLEQACLTDPGRTIDGLLYGRGIHLTGFARIAAGQPS